MKHAGPSTFARIPHLLGELRARPVLGEMRPGVFYLKSRAFLHFHDDPSGIFADVRLAEDFVRLPVTSRAQQSDLLERIDDCLSRLAREVAGRPSRIARAPKMKTKQRAPKTIDEYIAGFPREVREILQKIRATIRKAAPRAEEKISYQIPTFTLHGNLIHFAAYQHHIGLYPAPRGVAQFKEELSAYEGGKGTLQLPLDKPIPLRLITKIVKYRVKINLEKAQARRKIR